MKNKSNAAGVLTSGAGGAAARFGALPTTDQLREELRFERYRRRFGSTLRSTIYILITVCAVAVLISTLLFPIFRIYGSSMAPTLDEGNLVVALRDAKFEQGDLIAFYYNNKILIKRAIANSGEWVDIDQDGNVYVNGELLPEPYLKLDEKALGSTDLEYPYQVPEGKTFVMGDNRAVSIDSRESVVGSVASEQVAGKLLFKIWPLGEMGRIRTDVS